MNTTAASRTEALKNLWSMLFRSEGSADKGRTKRLSIKFASGDELRVELESRPLSASDAYAVVKNGISSRALGPLGQYLSLGKGAVAEYLGLDRATATRKVAKDEMLPTHAAESLLRLLELGSLAEGTFETPEEAASWLRRPHPMLDGEAPLDCAKSAYGAQRVKAMLVAIKYGGVV